MRSFGSYISKYLVSFAAFILILLFLNAVVFGLTFQKIVTEDYGDSSPQSMLEMTAAAATPEQLSDDAVQKLRQNHIWAIYLNADGQCYWSVDLPDNVPESYTIQDVALFSKGYIEDLFCNRSVHADIIKVIRNSFQRNQHGKPHKQIHNIAGRCHAAGEVHQTGKRKQEHKVAV